MPEREAWFIAVGQVLAGEQFISSADVDPSGGGEVSASAVVDWLARQGWTPERLQQHRQQRRDAGAPWPHPVNPGELLGPGTAARLHVLVGEVRTLTGTDGLVARQRPEHRVLGAADRRLLADVPPHHGSV